MLICSLTLSRELFWVRGKGDTTCHGSSGGEGKGLDWGGRSAEACNPCRDRAKGGKPRTDRGALPQSTLVPHSTTVADRKGLPSGTYRCGRCSSHRVRFSVVNVKDDGTTQVGLEHAVVVR